MPSNLNIRIIPVTPEHFNDWLTLILKVWTDASPQEMQIHFTEMLQSSREVGFLAQLDEGKAIAVINLSLRYEYVSGATHRPTAYLEGIYVEADYRQQGVGKRLIQQAEQWALAQGCTQLASDAFIDNLGSYAFHTRMGFQEVERIVTFVKSLSE